MLRADDGLRAALHAARIVHAGEARAVVHWHYALCDNRFRIFHGNTTADETYTVYPDGIAIRKLVGWPGDENDFGGNPTLWEVGEWIVLNPAGTVPETPCGVRRSASPIWLGTSST